MSTTTDTESGSLITRNYTGFRGVDFTDNQVATTRSPDALNMWKDYRKLGKCIETRPDIEKVETCDNSVYGLFFYTVDDETMMIIHCGTKLYKKKDGEEKAEIYTGMNPGRSQAFVFNGLFYLKDGINYLKFDGTTCSQVVGYIPTTSIGRKPAGGGTVYEDVNMLSAYRKNTFLADGSSTEYYLDAQQLDEEVPVVTVNGSTKTYKTDFSYDRALGKITFSEAPEEPLTVGQDNVTVMYKKTVTGYADRINRCSLLQVFDNRVFFSGNKNYPNAIFHCSLNDPSYCSDLDYYNEGLDLSPVTGMVAGNNALWVFKEPSQANTTVFYHNPTIDSEYGKIYPSSHSSVSTGCIGGAINFNDDICFFSDRGMEAINGDVTTEQVLAHRSTMVDRKLLTESEYKNMVLEEWEGYLLVAIGKTIYLADSRAMYENSDHSEYEWFYWKISKDVVSMTVKDGVLYICSTDGIYKMTNTNVFRAVTSYWTTPFDEFGYPQYQKTTNKRGSVSNVTGTVTVSARTDSNEWDVITTADGTKDYVVNRIKKKKWKAIQLKFSAMEPFELYSSTLEAYVGGYLKR